MVFWDDLLDLTRTIQELATVQRRTEEAITRLTERMEQSFAEAAEDRREMRKDLGWRKRIAKKQCYRVRVAAIFGHLPTQGYDATNQVADHLQTVPRAAYSWALHHVHCNVIASSQD